MRHAWIVAACLAAMSSLVLVPGITAASEPTDASTAPTATTTEIAAEPATAEPAAPQAEASAVIKTKTKSNQSNDRAATDTPDAEKRAEVLKTKTKSNQSND